MGSNMQTSWAKRGMKTWVLIHAVCQRGKNLICPDYSVHCHQIWALLLLIFPFQSLTLLITFSPLREIIVLLPFSLLSPSLHQIDTRALSKCQSSHSLFLTPPTHTHTIIPHLSCLNLFLSLVDFLLTSSLLGFSFFSVLNLAFSATLWDELISSLLCLSLPHLSGNLSLDCPSFSPFPMSICRVGLCPLQCADASPVTPTSEGSAEAPAPDFRHVCELMTWVKGSALTLNFLAFNFSSHSLTFL